LFGTPSAGLTRAQFVAFLKPQLGDLAHGSAFITKLRTDWRRRFGHRRPFELLTIAGERDVFVPTSSSLDPFPRRLCAVVPGDHLQIVKPTDRANLSVLMVRDCLLGRGAPSGPRSSANVAVEIRRQQAIVDRLWTHRTDLDPPALVQLAIGLDYVGRRADAVRVLECYGGENIDAIGTLAGRLKRRWLLERRRPDAERAKQLYARGVALADARSDHEQAFYQGINLAFMTLAFDRDGAAAAEIARQVIAHCDQAPDAPWSRATRGEAQLLLRNAAAAIDHYAAAVAEHPPIWQIESMYQQAMFVVSALRDQGTSARLEAVFADADG
jgi:hypothetical protein